MSLTFAETTVGMPCPPLQSGPRTGLLASVLLVALAIVPVSAWAADASYPFVGTWIRADRVCSATAIDVRIYTAKEVTSSRSHCTIRRVASSANTFELLEECRRGERHGSVTETIRMTSPDSMMLRRQYSRLKIPRSVRYARCNAASIPAHPAH
ncbi:hypothetical protein [Lichenihabitans psoromatis]|uniref:hypothetical protein n=1 Tax=Lichenihabitans psoromatis TaxID=2528642 RepID=UPI0010383FFC|nr:hypothetical protein [Lichenihabitans psoromatis]